MAFGFRRPGSRPERSTNNPALTPGEVTNDIRRCSPRFRRFCDTYLNDLRIGTTLHTKIVHSIRAIENVAEALRDGGISLVVIVSVSALNVRTPSSH